MLFWLSELIDDDTGPDGEVYIRNLCFSPDGKYLVIERKTNSIAERLTMNVAHTSNGALETNMNIRNPASKFILPDLCT